MNNNEIDKQKLMDAVLSSSGGKIDKQSLAGAIQSKNADALIKNLSPADREKLQTGKVWKRCLTVRRQKRCLKHF